MSGSWIADGPSDLKVKSSQEVRDKTDVTSVEMTFWSACGAGGNLFVVVDTRQVERAIKKTREMCQSKSRLLKLQKFVRFYSFKEFSDPLFFSLSPRRRRRTG